MDSMQENKAVDDVVRRLKMRYADFPAGRVKVVVTACHASLSNKPIRDFIPVLVEHVAVLFRFSPLRSNAPTPRANTNSSWYRRKRA